MPDKLLQEPEILATLIAIIAGVVGYFIREWLTRAQPFVSVIRIEGSSRRVAAKVSVPDRAVKSSTKSNLCDELADSSRLKDVLNTLATAKTIEARAQEVIDLIDAFAGAVNRRDAQSAQSFLEELMLDDDFDDWASSLLGERTVAVPAFDSRIAPLIECSEESSARGGCFAIGFPRSTLRFGSGLSNLALYKTNIRALVELISRLEYTKLAQVLESIKTELTKELGLARDLSPPLQEIADKNSQWSFRTYLANLGNAPFLVQTEAELEIKDQSGASFTEPCFLILLKQEQDREMRRVKAQSPLVVQSQHDTTFDFVTTKTQADLAAGETIRSMFKSGSARCRIRFTVERPGHFRRTSVTSAWTKFVDTRPSAA
jgi:hypothetical protein